MHGRLKINEQGRFVFGGWDVSELSGRFGTPLYVLSEEAVRSRCAELKTAFMDRWEDVSAVYAGKAFLTLAMCRIIQSEGLGLDLVSGGELSVARAAVFHWEKLIFTATARQWRSSRWLCRRGWVA